MLMNLSWHSSCMKIRKGGGPGVLGPCAVTRPLGQGPVKNSLGREAVANLGPGLAQRGREMSSFGRSVHVAALGVLFAVAALLCGARDAHAVGCAVSSSVYQLSDKNSVACVNVGSQA